MSSAERISAEEPSQWITIEAERVLYVDYGRIPILCDRGHSGPVTIIVKVKKP